MEAERENIFVGTKGKAMVLCHTNTNTDKKVR